MPFYMIPVVMLFPLVIGALTGVPAGLLLKKDGPARATLAILLGMVLLTAVLGAPLDYHLIMGAGLFTAIYIGSRAFGKYFGAWFGAGITHSPATVKKYLGLTLLPHSGVSLVFTGISAAALSAAAPENAQIIQGTIAAAAVINEIIAVVAAKKGFEWAGELETRDAVLSAPVQHTA